MAERMKVKVFVRVGSDGDGPSATAHAEQDNFALDEGNVISEAPYRDYVIEFECDVPPAAPPTFAVSAPSSAVEGEAHAAAVPTPADLNTA